ncbi:hypothetical protein [Paraburkholderia phenazinium]|uniref:hypothetical protein n=1 Tax=Paraburkholderia phenazinium TaxID=60549 RepID=UPI00158CACA6|nr:hypothetical protein [Paraburkholderia phenazinium]
MLRRTIFCNSSNPENPGHSAPSRLTLPTPLTKESKAIGGSENEPKDDFWRPGSVGNAAFQSDRQKIPIGGRFIWLFYQFLDICVTFSPMKLDFMVIFGEFL